MAQQSKNWENATRENRTGMFWAGFPFDEGWPRRYLNKTYTLILQDGTRLSGCTVDDSRQYRDEGFSWSTPRGNVGRQVVVAWQEETWTKRTYEFTITGSIVITGNREAGETYELLKQALEDSSLDLTAPLRERERYVKVDLMLKEEEEHA